jgi:hypothetical protein
MRATLLLAEAAQVAEGKLNVLGAGWSELAPGGAPMAIAVLIEFPASEANGDHHFELFLTDQEHQPVFTEGPNGRVAIEVRGDASVSLPEGFDSAVPVPWPIAVNIPGMVLPPGERYQWNLVVDGNTQPDWVLAFRTRPEPEPAG